MIERRDVGPHDVRLDILYCGICHSDLNFTGGEFGPLPTSPLVPGHEVVGRLTETGTEVTRHQVGDLVGIGCVVNSCRDCENCRAGQEQYCHNGHTLVFGRPDPAEPGAHTRAAVPRRSSHPWTSSSVCPTTSTRPPRRRCCAPA
ncbi:alcohol dehydrogenase catalytic domain-containing protein [Streptomyces sp. NPDC088178]|uniref:alcohol dehydrogenase catalytic domain-containing protein n=1 Tax=Streptomyces sp. NPDC088178 TaxID=3365836 RepID=UPI0037F1975B